MRSAPSLFDLPWLFRFDAIFPRQTAALDVGDLLRSYKPTTRPIERLAAGAAGLCCTTLPIGLYLAQPWVMLAVVPALYLVVQWGRASAFRQRMSRELLACLHAAKDFRKGVSVLSIELEPQPTLLIARMFLRTAQGQKFVATGKMDGRDLFSCDIESLTTYQAKTAVQG